MAQQSDPDTSRALRTSRRALARRVQEKAQLEQQVRAAQSRFEAEVAPLQEEVLRLQMERLKDAAQARMRSARLRNAYQDFREQRLQDLQYSSPSTGNLKATYRRATKLCHPDAVADSYHEEAAATFRALESAYAADHPEAVRAIAEVLDAWGFPKAPDASAQEGTTATLRRAVSEIESSIERLRTSEAYRVLTEEEDWDVEAVVGARKRTLQKRLAELKRQPHGRR